MASYFEMLMRLERHAKQKHEAETARNQELADEMRSRLMHSYTNLKHLEEVLQYRMFLFCMACLFRPFAGDPIAKKAAFNDQCIRLHGRFEHVHGTGRLALLDRRCREGFWFTPRVVVSRWL